MVVHVAGWGARGGGGAIVPVLITNRGYCFAPFFKHFLGFRVFAILLPFLFAIFSFICFLAFRVFAMGTTIALFRV